MEFDRILFYVENAKVSRDWFVSHLGFKSIAGSSNSHTSTESVSSGNVCFVLSSPLTPASPAASWLKFHPPGIADVGFRVKNIELAVARAAAAGAQILEPIQKNLTAAGCFKRAKIAGWGDLSHTLIEQIEENLVLRVCGKLSLFTLIDHVVLNVESGDLSSAVSWYQKILGFTPQQNFDIKTENSALRSQVMMHAEGGAQFPINEPASTNSQIQEFLTANRGSGIQHMALQTADIVGVVTDLRSRGLPFLPVPATYYSQLQERQNDLPADWQAIAASQVLADWQDNTPAAMLLQIFTQPIFSEPTFFFEIIERRVALINGKKVQAGGFGAGNFRALFEAIEREQMKRGNLIDN
ncbi:4-hydroxyphenylpyruvate dioxygenase [Tychonema sp. LEGE 07199]|uniref:4-hydroxyphenylpyruvate dioxygenase n=1 Tax=unclassified Tychonema TaxID=2642144 RepID=UPI0018824631|nr:MULTISPECIES: 4-hydroxyphenylpyruvate dioxygenase [unclassified Tychonema]MBE9123767.1 4-hydroxyphenylpyruvate dioxygenase [Tychonema sp. LEGE 07199]MBE9133303.1 4-hydroxyphenylpyruvate dioxygenase [Tychonema sp. LEGE 07196]